MLEECKSLHKLYFMSLAYQQILEEACKRKNDLSEICLNHFVEKVISLEIGCGHGHFLIDYAQAYSEKTFVGIDLSTDRINRGKKKQERAMLSNVMFIKAEATEFLEALPENIFLDQVFILFPDPWPKTRHHKNRVMQQNFLNLLASKSLKDAKLFFRTDHEPYFVWTKKEILENPFWELDSSEWPFEAETVFQKKMNAYQSLVARRI